MSDVFWIGAAICGGALALLLVAEWRDDMRLRFATKPIASTGFLLAAWGAGAFESAYGVWIFAALIGCWWGDVLLIPKGKGFFLAGLVAFLLGHLGFIGAFLVRGVDWIWAAIAAVPSATAATLVYRWLAPQVPDELRRPVLVYTIVITAMVVLAAGAVGVGATPWVLGGALAFWLSDISVARDRFAGAGFANRAWGLPAYFGACVVLAATIGL